MHNIYTDIACEIYSKRCKTLPRGVIIKSSTKAGINCTHVEITKNGLRRAKGSYITYDMPSLSQVEPTNEAFVCAVAQNIKALLPQKGTVLVVGIGNRAVLADSLGPETADKIFVTNKKQVKGFPLRQVAAISPGVCGATGLETLSVLKGVIGEMKPVCAVIIDSLYTLSPQRMGASVQISNTGLKPKTGDNLDAESLGVPTIAVGVPTITNWHLQEASKTITVTPKDIDAVIEKASALLALAVNKALQPALSVGELCFLTS